VLTVLLATFGWVLVGWLPGMLAVNCLRPAAGRLRNALLAPMVSLGLTMIAAQGLQSLHIRIEPATVLPLSMGIPVICWIWVARRRRQSATDGQRSADESIRLDRLGAGLLGFAVLLGLFIWCIAIPSISSVLPNDDGTHHGLFAARILQLGTLDPHQVLAGDLASEKPTSNYYPLALHLTTALISGITHAPVSAVLTVGYVLAASVLLPLGMFVLTRRLLPQLPMAAPVSAVIAASFPWFPHGVVIWGGIPLIFAMSQVPAGIDAVWRRDRDGPPLAVGLVLGFAGYGLFQEHNSELVTVCLFGAVLAFADRGARITGEGHRLLRTWAVAGGLFAMLVLPVLPQLIKGANDASSFLGNGTLSSSQNTSTSWLAVVLVVGNPLITLLAIAGLVVSISRRWCPGWIWSLVITAVLVAGAALSAPVLTTLTAPWYSSWGRISYWLVYFEAVFGAVGVVLLVPKAIAAVSRRNLERPQLAAPLVVAVLGLIGLAFVLPFSAGLVASGYHESSLNGPDQRAAFTWLAAHTRPDDRVLNQFSDGSGWMETLDRVSPLFATKADTSPVSPQQGWGDRWYLLTHAGSLATDTRAQQAAERWHVRYVYLNTHVFDGHESQLSLSSLSRSPAYRQVWRRGTVTIFQVMVT
jgi:hypothetical protein